MPNFYGEDFTDDEEKIVTPSVAAPRPQVRPVPPAGKGPAVRKPPRVPVPKRETPAPKRVVVPQVKQE